MNDEICAFLNCSLSFELAKTSGDDIPLSSITMCILGGYMMYSACTPHVLRMYQAATYQGPTASR